MKTDGYNEWIEVVIPIFGDLVEWTIRADEAVKSVQAQTVPTFHSTVLGYGDYPLADARNRGLRAATRPYVICLDADDVLEEDYVSKMLTAIRAVTNPADVYWPTILRGGQYVSTELDHSQLPAVNHVVAGAAVRVLAALDCGGFGDFEVLEDHSLWAKMYLAGYNLRPCLSAVYHHRVRAGSMMDTWDGMHDEVERRVEKDAREWAARRFSESQESPIRRWTR